MSEKASTVKLGVFVIVGVAALLGALFLFGIRSLFEKTHRFETYVTGDVEGLSRGSAVKLRGVAVGKVTEIGFSWNIYGDKPPRCVVVRFDVKESVSPIPVNSPAVQATLHDQVSRHGLRAIIQAEGITGSSIVSLQNLDPARYPALEVSWTPEYLYIPSAPSQFGQILAAVDKTLDHLQKLDVAGISASVTRTLDSADAALRKISELDTAGLSGRVGDAASDASAALREVQGLAGDARKSLAAMQLDAVGQDAARLLTNLDGRLGILIEKLDGIDVRAVNDTFAGTREAARSLNEVLEELRRYPAGFLFGKPPAPAPGLAPEKK